VHAVIMRASVRLSAVGRSSSRPPRRGEIAAEALQMSLSTTLFCASEAPPSGHAPDHLRVAAAVLADHHATTPQADVVGISIASGPRFVNQFGRCASTWWEDLAMAGVAAVVEVNHGVGAGDQPSSR
jgi:hypothetical protein